MWNSHGEAAQAPGVLQGKVRYGLFYGINKMYLLMEKQHNRGQDGAGFASIKFDTDPGTRYISRVRSNNQQPIQDIFNED